MLLFCAKDEHVCSKKEVFYAFGQQEKNLYLTIAKLLSSKAKKKKMQQAKVISKQKREKISGISHWSK